MILWRKRKRENWKGNVITVKTFNVIIVGNAELMGTPIVIIVNEFTVKTFLIMLP